MTYLLVMLQMGAFQEQVSPSGAAALPADSASVAQGPGSSTPTDSAAAGTSGARVSGASGDAFISASAAAFSVHALSDLLARDIERDNFKWCAVW